MSKINNGGPAFPRPADRDDCGAEGMTLRDYFAAKALQGLLASWSEHDVIAFDEIASDAYGYADAMLKAREVE